MLQTNNGAHERNLLGRGMSRQLMSALEQSQAFNALGYRLARNETEAQESEGAMSAEAADKSAEESEEAQLEISGTLLAYALSPVSVTGGFNEDPLLHELENDPSANNTFQQLFEKAEGISEDKISIELRLMDAHAKNEISAIAFHCTPEDWESTLKGWFDEPLRQALTPPRTPIQQATQACLIRIVNWVGDKYDAWKKNPEKFLNYRKIQKDLNALGYSCGEVDGKRGSKTETCIQQFLSDKGIGEKDLESKIAEEVKRLSSP
jgi:curli biogenesis system outer membrane secretion channel CsgG